MDNAMVAAGKLSLSLFMSDFFSPRGSLWICNATICVPDVYSCVCDV